MVPTGAVAMVAAQQLEDCTPVMAVSPDMVTIMDIGSIIREAAAGVEAALLHRLRIAIRWGGVEYSEISVAWDETWI